MIQGSLNFYFMMASIIVGFISIGMVWIYIIENIRGITVVDFKLWKKYINWLYIFSIAMLSILWITSPTSVDKKVLTCVWILTIAWAGTAIGSLIVSFLLPAKATKRLTVRKLSVSSVFKIIWFAGVLWFIY